jgi:L-fucose isomerase-like protein
MGHVLEEAGRVLGLSFAPLGPVRSGEEAQQVARRVEAEGYELLLLGLVTFATGDVLRPLLELGVPKVFWALPEAWIGGVLPQNALCGLNLALSLPSLGPAKWLYGPPDPGGLANALAPTAKAVRGLKVLREARLLWLGGPAPGFDRFAERPTTGARVEERDLEAFFAAYEAVAQEEVSRALESWKGLASLGEAGARLT